MQAGFALTGKVAIITGAASGIGAATARRFASAGARLVLANYAADGHDMNAVVADVLAGGGEVEVVEADMRRGAEVDRLVEVALRGFGAVDIAIANAAIARIAPLAIMTEADFNATLDV